MGGVWEWGIGIGTGNLKQEGSWSVPPDLSVDWVGGMETGMDFPVGMGFGNGEIKMGWGIGNGKGHGEREKGMGIAMKGKSMGMENGKESSVFYPHNWLTIGGVAGVVAVRLDTSGWGSGWGSTWGSWWDRCWDSWLVIAGLFGGGGWIANN